MHHESLRVYQKTIEFVAWSSQLCQSSDRISGENQSQFKRAFISIPLNIAEGSGKQSGKDQARFYDIARGSALECGACLDVLVAMEILTIAQIQDGKACLVQIVSMLTALARSVAGDRLAEEAEEFELNPITEPST
ncbi:MAG: four helix bundle protein [Planctomycetota bacterium]